MTENTNKIPIEHPWVLAQNLGWDGTSYITQFVFEGIPYRSVFSSEKATDETCPNPELRLSYDKEYLENRLGLIFMGIADV